MRTFLFACLFISSSLFAQRDSVINGIKCHLVAKSSDTGTTWIQRKIINKKKNTEKFNGRYWEFYPGGKVKASGYYKNGKRDEKWIRYYPNGKKSEEGYFDKGFKSNIWMTYFESGKMSWKGNYFKNMRAGVWRYFYEDGKLKGMTRYRVKTQKIAKKPKSGVKRGISVGAYKEITYTISPADSLVEYYPNGKLRTRIIYGHEGGLTGSYAMYYDDGTIKVRGQYLDGKKTGTWEYFCSSGALFYKTELIEPSPLRIEDGPCEFGEELPLMKWEVEQITI